MRIPYPTWDDAEVVKRVLTVDRELRPQDVQKEWFIVPLATPPSSSSSEYTRLTQEHYTPETKFQKSTEPASNPPSAPTPNPQVELQVTIRTSDVRSLRLSVNGVLEDLALVTRSIEAFRPETMRAQRNRAGELEMGSVGRAG